jgi:signal transduction histidine kinase
MNLPVFDPATAYLAAGLLYLVMPLAAWVVMGNSRTLAAGVWCGGSFGLGLGSLLLSFRTPDMPGWIAFGVMNAFFYGGNLMHVVGLRMELGQRSAWRLALLAGVVMLGVQEFFRLGLGSAVLRLGWVLLAMGSLFAWTAWLAWRVHKREGSLSARWLMQVYALGAAATLLRAVRVFLELTTTDPLAPNWDSVLTTMSLFVMSVFGSVAILGLYLERSNRKHLADEVAIRSQQTSQLLAQPLTAVSTECGLLQRDLAQAHPSTLAQLQSITGHVNRAVKILQGIRNFIRPADPEFKSVNLRVVVQDVLQLWSGGGQQKGVNIRVRDDVSEPWVYGDVVQLSQVLLNVLRNAAQAQVPGRAVQIDIHVQQVDARWHVVIEDDGPGFPAQVLERTDVAFASTKKDGMGIGLSISRRIVVQHGGALLLANRENASGARVVMALPAVMVSKGENER